MIEISHLVKRYGNNYAVNDISFQVEKGEIVGFLGPNGAGKTTTMNILTGYLSATSGKAKIAGIDILENPMEAKSHIGFLPEHPPLYTDMTVKEYLNFVYNLKKCKLKRKDHIEEIVDVMNIKDVYKRPIEHLSKGYRQRVGIAQALIGNPDVLIFDEPTVGLDPKQIIEIRNLITSLGKSHTVILSTHILSEVQSVCDRVIIINKGRLVADKKTDELHAFTGSRKLIAKICGPEKEVLSCVKGLIGVTSAETLGKTEVGSYSYLVESESNVDIRKPLFRLLCQKDFALIGLEPAEKSLEDIFISIVDGETSAADKNTVDINAAGTDTSNANASYTNNERLGITDSTHSVQSTKEN